MSSWLSEQSGPFADFLQNVRSRRLETEALGHLPADMVQQLKDIGIYRALVPRVLGGDERTPMEFLEMVEAVAAADASVGWVASFAGASAYLASLEPHRFEEFYANGPDVAFAAGLFPVQPVQRDGDMLIVSGRWKFASGSSGADWLGVGIAIADAEGAPKPRMIVFPREKAEIIGDWRVVGLAGTGSFDLVLKDVRIPADWSFIRGGGSSRTEPIYQFPAIVFSTLNHAIVGIGAGRGAVRDALASADGDRRHLEALYGAEARLLAARSLIFDRTRAVWETVQKRGNVEIEDLNLLRLGSKHASELAVEAARCAVSFTGDGEDTAATDVGRHLRDALVVGQHAFLSPSVYETGGGLFLGRAAAPGYI